MEKVTHLFLVTDSSKKGTDVIKTIKAVADDLVMYDKVGVIANRLPNTAITDMMQLGDLQIAAKIPSDPSLAEFDLKGENVFYLPSDASIVEGTREALRSLQII